MRFWYVVLMGILLMGISCTSSDTEDGTISLAPNTDRSAEIAVEEPGDLAYSEDEGQIFVSDPAQHRIVELNRELETVNQFGEQGGGPGDLNRPTSMQVREDELFIYEEGNRRISVFSTDGEFIETGYDIPTIQLMNFALVDDSSTVYATDSGDAHLAMDRLDEDDDPQRFGRYSNEEKSREDRLRNLGFVHRHGTDWLFVSPFRMEAHLYDEDFELLFEEDLEAFSFFDFLSEGEEASRGALQLYLGESQMWGHDLLVSAWTLNDDNELRILEHLLRFSIGEDGLDLETVYTLDGEGERYPNFLPVGDAIYAWDAETGRLSAFTE